MNNPLADLAEQILQDEKSWSQAQCRSTAEVAASLVNQLMQGEFQLICLSGSPGCGKSTLAHLIAKMLDSMKITSQVVSLDDYYLSKEERNKVAEIHPLFARRGVAGTHKWAALVSDLDKLRAGDVSGLLIPRFNKSTDDVEPPECWTAVAKAPKIIILEGWLLGAVPQTSEMLNQAVNSLELKHDPEGIWRNQVNHQLQRYREDLSKRVSTFWFLASPGWNQVLEWRWHQEQDTALEHHQSFLSNQAAVAQFLEPFQRTAMDMISNCHKWANVIIDIDENHHLKIRQRSA